MSQLINEPYVITANTVHVWHCKFNANLQNIDHYLSLLSEDEREKAYKFRFKKDRQASIIARGILRILLGNYLNMPPNEIEFNYGAYGKPQLDSSNALKFNISHSGNRAVFAFVINHDIGIDIEYIKSDFDVLDIADNYFSKEEITALHQLPEETQTEAFYRGWTRKEAFIKAKAKGLSFPLDSFSIAIDSDEKAKLTQTLWDKNEKKSWQIIPFKTEPDYKAAIAVNGKVETVSYFEFKP